MIQKNNELEAKIKAQHKEKERKDDQGCTL